MTDAKDRICVQCNKKFASTGPGNRRCGPCKRGGAVAGKERTPRLDHRKTKNIGYT